jgi:hypothetical protein
VVLHQKRYCWRMQVVQEIGDETEAGTDSAVEGEANATRLEGRGAVCTAERGALT